MRARRRQSVLLTALVAPILMAGLPAPAQSAPSAKAAAAAGAVLQAPARQAAPLDEPAPGPASYAYDAAGRLAGMIAADGAIARYVYDATGNVLRVDRIGTPAVAVLSAVPSRVRVGGTVALTGTGFGTTASANAVTFNGSAATVQSATADRLVVTVPTGASSGSVSVTSPAGNASLDGITVLGDDRPAISDVNPTTVAPGDSVTLTVVNPDPELANNLVRFNGILGTVTARTATSLTVTVPPAAGTGYVQFATPAGSATSTDVLVVPPAGLDPANLDTSGPLPIDVAETVSIAAGKYALRYVPAVEGDRFAVALAASTFGSCGLNVTVYNERNVQTGATSCISSTGWVETSPAGGAGMRTLLLSNNSANAGSTSVTVYKVPADVDAGTQPLDGTPKTVAIGNPGRNGFTTFTGTAGQRVILQSTATPSQLSWWLAAPDGHNLSGTRTGNSTLDTLTLPDNGTYRIWIDPSAANIGSATVAVWNVPPDLNAGEQPLDGTPATVTVTAPGRNAYTTFEATTGDRLLVQSSASTSGFIWWVAAPDGARVGTIHSGNTTQDTVVLPQTGTYRLVVDPPTIVTGSITLAAWGVPANTDAGEQPLDGTPTTVTVANPGQSAFTSFAGLAGQQVLIQSTATPSTFGWQLTSPTGVRVGSAMSGNAILDTVVLPADGTYRIDVNPSGIVTGSSTLAAWLVPADVDAGAQALDGSTTTVTIGSPGQRGYTTFTGTTGQRVLIQSTATPSTFGWQLTSPTGIRVGSSQSGNAIQDSVVLPADGTYRVDVNPTGINTGSATFAAWLAPDVDNGAQAMNGTAKTFTVPSPGQSAYSTFSGVTGQRVIMQGTNTPSTFAWQLTSPTGTRVGSAQSGNSTLDTIVLPADGTYRIDVNPSGVNTGSATISAWTVPTDLDAGAQALDGTPKTVTITDPGRNAYTTFSATAGQRVSVQTTATPSTFGWQLTAPNGTRVGSAFAGNATLDTVTLPADGVYRIDINPSGVNTGSTTITAWNAPDLDAGVQLLDGTPKTVTIGTSGQNAFTTFAGTTGQRVILQSTATPSTFGWQLTSPTGTRVGSALSGNTILDTVTLPADGTYRIDINPSGAATGSTTIAAWLVPSDVDGGTQPLDGTTRTVTVGAPGQGGFTSFAGTTGQKVLVQSTNATSTFGWQLTSPTGTRVGSALSGNAILDTVTLPADGTYRIDVNPTGVTTGAATFAAWFAPDANTGAQPLDGSTKAITVTTPGQTAYSTFSGTTGQRVIIQSTNTAATFGWQLTAPSGTRVGSALSGNTILDAIVLPQDGTYRIDVNPSGLVTGAATMAAWNVPADLDGGVQPLDGSTRTVTVTDPGRNAYTTFTGVTGQRVLVQTTATPSTFGWQLTSPTGTRVGSSQSGNAIQDAVTLPADGTYRVDINPTGVTTGSATIAAWNAPDVDAGAQPLDGSTRTVTISTPGQNAFTTFSGTTGQRVIIQSTATPSTFGWQLTSPTGTRVGSSQSGNAVQDTVTLAADGTYRIDVNPTGVTTGSSTLAAWSVPADVDAGTQPLTGTTKTITVGSIGQNGYATFTGTTGQKVLVQSTNTPTTIGWQLTSPTGARVGSSQSGNAIQDTVTLPADGTYRIDMNPTGVTTGSATFAAWLAPDADAGTQPLTGTTKTITVSTPGQTAYSTFTGTTGQRVIIQSTNTATTFGWQLTSPTGTRVGSSQSGNAIQDTVALPADGTYRVDVNPTGVNTGNATIAAWAVASDVDAGSQPLDGTTKTVAIGSPGQVGFTTFSGTTGQKVLIQSTNTPSTFGWQLTSPTGTRVGSALSGNTILDTVVLPADGTYRIDVNPTGVTTGSGTFAAWNAPDVNAGTQALDGTTKAIAVTGPGQTTYSTFTGTTGQRVIIQSTTTPSTFVWQLTSPTGTRVGATQSGNSTLDTIALPADGTYRIDVNPSGVNTGTATIAAWNVPADVDAGALPLTATPTTISVTNPGQDAFASFTGSAGQRVIIQSSAGSSSITWWVNGPTGTRIGSTRAGNATLDITLPTAGVHKLIMSPTGTFTGSTTYSATSPGMLSAAGHQRTGTDVLYREPRVTPATDTSVRVPTDLRAADAATVTTAPADPQLDAAWTPDGGNIAGADWLTRRPAPAAMTNLTAPAGVTAVSGHVRGLDGVPLAGIPVRMDTVRTTTDAQGRFLLSGVRSTATTVIVDGYAAAAGRTRYGTFRIRAQVSAGLTTPLAATVWLPRLDMRHTVRISAPTTGETVLRTPAIPGLEVRLPAGSVVRDLDGNVVRELGITAIPLDRPPFPLPRNGIVPTYFTVQPGGAAIFPTGASVVYPNYTDLPPGVGVDFWNYDPADKGWYVYGHGTVSADGTQVVPDERTRLWTLDGAMFNTPDNPEADDNWWDDLVDALSGDPVDLSTGLLTDSHTDMGLSDTLPVTLTRTYWQGDGNSREFGLNSGADFNMFLTSALQYQEVDLNLPGGGRVHYTRTSAGTSYSDAVFGVSGTSGRFAGSTIAQISGDWVLSLRDGTKWFFPWYSRPRAVQDRNGNKVTFVRDSSNSEVEQILSPNGRWIALEYDAEERVVSASDNIGRGVGYTYDDAGRLATVVDVAGGTTTYAYDDANRITTITDPRGVLYLQNSYDENGRVAEQTLPGGATYTFVYELDGNGAVTATRVTQPNGAVRRVTFDANHLVTSDTEAHGTALARTTGYERGADNRIVAEVDPHGRRTEFGYDGQGRPTSVTALAGTANEFVAAETSFGPLDRPVSTTDALGETTTYSYDPKGNLTSYTDPLGDTTALAWTSAGQLAATTSPGGARTEYGYSSGAMVSVRDALGRVTERFVDAAGRAVTTVDAAGAATALTYDARNNVTRMVDPLGGESTFSFDANGNLTGFTDQRGKASSWAYDDADRVVSSTEPVGRITTSSYDPSGRLTTSVLPSGLRSTTAYDLLDRPTTVRYGVSGSSEQSQVTNNYDALDRLASRTDSAGGSVGYGYDVRDRVVSATGPNGTVGYGYDAGDRQVATTVPGAPATAYGYDAAGRLTSVSGGGDSTTLAYDVDGRLDLLTLPGGWTQDHDYDTAGQLTGIAYRQAGVDKGSLGYTYDPTGRRTSVTGSRAGVVLPQSRADLVYDDANRLVSAGGITLAYDPDGNLTGDGTTAYSWDARGQLSGTTAAGGNSAYTYDADGERTSRTVGGTTTKFLLDGPNVAAELDAAGAVTATLQSGGTDQWFGRSTAGSTDTVLTDALGSPVAFGRPDGTDAATAAHDPFGNPALTGDARGSDLSFTGRQDDGTGLLHYRARYYSPTLQRFISPDPIGMDGGTNLYAYVDNSPTNYTDPSGNNPLVGCLVGGLIGGGLDYLAQRLGGRKVDWGDVAISAGIGCIGGALMGMGPKFPRIKPGSSGGPTAGKPFPKAVRDGALKENPNTCVYCRMKTDKPQVDHSIPKSRGGNATPENAQTTCPHCNGSKNNRDFPVNPPPGYTGPWPPSWW